MIFEKSRKESFYLFICYCLQLSLFRQKGTNIVFEWNIWASHINSDF